MKCEYCGKPLRHGDLIHGIKYGELTSSGFKPARDSAVTVICGPCGNMVSRLVYAKLDPGKAPYPVLFRMYEELKASMKNGFKVIQALAKLPVSDQKVIQRWIAICKDTN